MPTPTPIVFDMETQDPDDVFTLCALATHPWARLVAVTVTPGSDEQIGVVEHVLRQLDVDAPDTLPPVVTTACPAHPHPVAKKVITQTTG